MACVTWRGSVLVSMAGFIPRGSSLVIASTAFIRYAATLSSS
jgi:hypothetical protein